MEMDVKLCRAHAVNYSRPGIRSKARKDPEDLTELHLVKGQSAWQQGYDTNKQTLDGAA